MKAVKFSPIFGNNIGDVLISHTIEALLNKHGVEVESKDWMFRPPLGFDRRIASSPTFRQRVSNRMQVSFPQLYYALKKKKLNEASTKANFKNNMADCECVILGGGNLIMNNMGSDYADRLLTILTTAPVGAKKVIYSVGVGPFLPGTGETLLREILTLSDYISVRDEKSADFFYDIPDFRPEWKEKLSITPDPAIALNPLLGPDNTPTRRSGSVIGLNLIANFFRNDDFQTLARGVAEITKVSGTETPPVLRIINSAYPSDPPVSSRFIEVIREIVPDLAIEKVDLEATFESLHDAYSDLDLMIGCRLHSLIFAASFDVPIIGYRWDEKVADFIGQVYGPALQPTFCIDRGVSPREAVTALRNKPEITQAYRDQVAKMQTMVHRHAEHVASILIDGRESGA